MPQALVKTNPLSLLQMPGQFGQCDSAGMGEPRAPKTLRSLHKAFKKREEDFHCYSIWIYKK